jgi:RNA polymerase sigma factor (sigma-70 family)
MTQNQESTFPAASPVREMDNTLAKRARQSPDAFAELYERYLDGIFHYCARRVGNVQVAEDITANVFERALSRIDTFRDGSFRAWLFRIAHNAVTDYYRSRRHVIPWQPEMSGPDIEPSPEDYALAIERRTQIRELLNTLTEDQRRVVELRLSGLTGSEIAEVIDRSPDAVKMLQYRALERMRTQLTSEPEDAEIGDD